MKGIVFTGDRALDILEFPDPEPGPGQVVIRVMASGMCGSDLHSFRSPTPPPYIAGHEPCGEVTAVGEGVLPRVARRGDRVTVHHYAGCAMCDQCRSGWYQLCRQGAVRYAADAHGSHAEFMLVPANTLVPIPDSMEFETGAAIGCGTGTAWGALLRLGDLTAADLLISGQGPVGLSATMIASAFGLRTIAVDVDQNRLDLARSCGATDVIDASQVCVEDAVRDLTRGIGVSHALETSGSSTASAAVLSSLATWGRACFVGLGGEPFQVDVTSLLRTQATLMTSWTLSLPDLVRCVDFVDHHALPVGRLFTDRWRLEDAHEAYALFDQQAAGKGVFLPA